MASLGSGGAADQRARPAEMLREERLRGQVGPDMEAGSSGVPREMEGMATGGPGGIPA